MPKRVRNDMLGSGKRSVTQVGMQLGYKDVADFHARVPSEYAAASKS
jgi:hypothetical protein